MERKARTVGDLFANAVRLYSTTPALAMKESDVWHSQTWKEYGEQVRLTARAFMNLGLKAGDVITIIGRNQPRWFISDIAAILAGGSPTGIYTTSSPEQCRFVAADSRATIAVVEDQEQLSKFLAIRDSLPSLRAIVMMQGKENHPGVYSWDELAGLAEAIPDEELDRRISLQKPNDVCTLIYTSGTTGTPKAVMITHDNLTWTASVCADLLTVTTGEPMISYLPLSHIAEQIISLHFPMTVGSCCWFVPDLELLPDRLRDIRPCLFIGVPRVWEKIQAKIQTAAAENPPWKKKLGAWARRQGLRGGYAEQNLEPKPMLYHVADRIVFSKVREKLGLDRCRLIGTTAAPISLATLEFFLSLGIPLLEVFGMSECTGPATLSLPHSYRTGKAGRALPGTDIKIADDGEILIKGRHVFAGYANNETATRETIDDDGWLHTGDIGTLDTDGFLSVTDRKKEIIITSGGINIPPQLIEGKLKTIPAVSQAAVIGNNRKFLIALLTLDTDRLTQELEKAVSPATDCSSAAACPLFHAYLQSQIDPINASLTHYQAIKKFAIIPQDFSIEGGELTPTMKLKRKFIAGKYADLINKLYRK